MPIDLNLIADRAADNPIAVKMFLSQTARDRLRAAKDHSGLDMSAILDALIRTHVPENPADLFARPEPTPVTEQPEKDFLT